MRLATLENGEPDGALAVVSADNLHAAPCTDIAPNLQAALDRWEEVSPQLKARYDAVCKGEAAYALAFDPEAARAPLPRAWQWLDASAFHSHGDLMQTVFDVAPTPRDRPLMYQGLSDTFYGPTEDAPFVSEADGIDFEGEFGVIVDRTPMGVSPEQAERHIRLVVQINDWSLRALAAAEMKTGFGWVQAKPPCSMAPVALGPEALGVAWRDGRVDLPLLVDWNGQRFGAAEGYEMAFSFPELIAHAARTRSLCAGTVIGSGTVSNARYREVGSSCIAERRGIEILDEGAPRTPFMAFGDRVRMEARSRDGGPLFGAIAQRVVAAPAAATFG